MRLGSDLQEVRRKMLLGVSCRCERQAGIPYPSSVEVQDVAFYTCCWGFR